MSLRDLNEGLESIGRSATLNQSGALDRSRGAPRSAALPVPKGASHVSNESGSAPVDACVSIEVYKIAFLYTETARRISSYEKLARENKELWAALAFGQYLQWSGLLEIFETHSRDGAHPINGPLLRHRVVELLHDVRERFKAGGVPEPLPQLDAINHKLDLIAGRIALLKTNP